MKRITKASNIGDLSTVKGWDNLDDNEKATITAETKQVASCLHEVSTARIAVGKHLSVVRDVLEPKRIFTSYLKVVFHLSKATAYRYIDLFETAEIALPPAFLEIAMLRPDNPISSKTLREAPRPPRTDNVIKINEYLDSLKARGVVREDRTPDEIRKAMFQSSRMLLRKLPPKQVQTILTTVTGMLMNEFAISVTIPIRPVPIPDSFRPKQGRPRQAA